MSATRKSLGLAGILASFISLIFACTLLMSSVCAQSAFAGTTDEPVAGTMTIQLDTSEPDSPNPDPDNPNPNPNPGDNGNGENENGNGENANNDDGSNGNSADGALKATTYNGKNGKGILSSTGDVVSAVLVALFAISAVFLGCVCLSRRRAVSVNGTDGLNDSRALMKLRTAFIVMLGFALIAGGVFASIKAFAEGDVTDAGKSDVMDATSTITVDKDGNIKSTSITLQNKLKTPVTVKTISAPTELQTWTSSINANTEIDAEGKTSGTWNTGDSKIASSILDQLSEDNISVEFTFESEVSYTSYEVTWNANDGNGVFDTTPVPANGNVVLPSNEPTREHYTFAGWNKSADGNGEEVTENTVVTGDVTFYAKWTPETYKITYVGEGTDWNWPDHISGVVKEYTYGDGVSEGFESPEKVGYDFEGWYDSETGGSKVESVSTTDFGDKTLYARWTASANTAYKVEHYKQNVDNDNYPESPAETENLTGTTDQQTSATAKSYDGFMAQPVEQKTIKADGSTVVQIKYDRIKYDVTFDLSGKTGSAPATQQVKFEGKATKPTDPSVTGYTFDGWYINSNLSGQPYDFENRTVSGSFTLYAKWTPITYTVKFDKNDTTATGSMTDQSFTYDTAQKLTACTFIKTDSTFLGWAEAPDGDKKYNDAEEVKNLLSTDGATVTLYAKWDDRPTYTVTYDANGGTVSPAYGVFMLGYIEDESVAFQTSDVKVKANDTLLKPDVDEQYSIPVVLGANADAYVFDGWYTQPNGNGDKVEIGATKITKNETFYAKYVVATTFFAPSSSKTVANARTISGIKYPIEYLKNASKDIADKGTNSAFYSTFNDWMTNDSFHLYTLLKGTDGNYLDPSLTDSWAEFRLIHVGDHDDGSTLTWQMVHGLPDAYRFDSIGATGANLNWEKSTLRQSMLENGSIYNLFDSDLIDAARSVEKKYNTTAGSSTGVATTTDKLWILSYTEYTSNVNEKYWTKDQLGSTYSYWAGKNVVSDGQDASKYPEIVALCKTRSGKKISPDTAVHSNAFQRSVSPNKSGTALLLGTTGYLGSWDNGYAANTRHAVNVAFAM